MPLPTNMKDCMVQMKKEYPHGRSKKKMSKQAAHAQRVAICMQATGQSNEGLRMMTFKEFLMEGDVVQFKPKQKQAKFGGSTEEAHSLLTHALPRIYDQFTPNAVKICKQALDKFKKDPKSLTDNEKFVMRDAIFLATQYYEEMGKDTKDLEFVGGLFEGK